RRAGARVGARLPGRNGGALAAAPTALAPRDRRPADSLRAATDPAGPGAGRAGRAQVSAAGCGAAPVEAMSRRSSVMFSIGLSEIVLIVNDVKAAARFYRDVVGLTPETEADDAWAWFWAGVPGQAQRVALHKGTLLFEDQSPLPTGERWG